MMIPLLLVPGPMAAGKGKASPSPSSPAAAAASDIIVTDGRQWEESVLPEHVL
jgi:hypothetical protein